MSTARWVAAGVAVLAGAAALLWPTGAQGVDGPADPAVTVRGPVGRFDDFSGLELTVSQTEQLTRQAITITWRGGRPTPRGPLGVDYLQIMQCWGTPDAANLRETCQFGVELPPIEFGPAVFGIGSANANRRDAIAFAPDGPDPAETLPPDAVIVPFTSRAGERTPHGGAAAPFPTGAQPAQVLAPFFSRFTTNEVPYAITTGDGTGRVVFEVQTALEAPHLGCGAVVQGRTQPCTLVIVPRGSHEPHRGGDLKAATPRGAVNGSPLVPAVWANRIAIPLEFEPVTGLCPIGRAERRTVGSELVAEAVGSWQPALCPGNGPIFGYSFTGDSDARQQVLSTAPGAPGLAFTADPAVPAEGQPPVVHAPVTLSAAVLAFTVDLRLDNNVPPEVEPLRATAVRDLRLTPRLVAKLLTQSYQRDAPRGQSADYLAGNPRSLRDDPEFLDLNPLFANTLFNFVPSGVLVAGRNSAAAREVWRWILADAPTRAWLSGQPDESGMRVNKHYGEVTAGPPLEFFPKADPNCLPVSKDLGEPDPGRCTLELFPYVGALGEAAYQTLRADSKAKSEWDPNRLPPGYGTVPPQPVGQRFALSITDSASAARYGLFTAQLCRSAVRLAGKYTVEGCIGATPDSMLTAAGAMVPSGVDGVVAIDPVRVRGTAGAYPLTMLTYAAADLSEDVAARRDYATLLRYAAGAGQHPGRSSGDLPPGYSPLPQALRVATMRAADTLERYVPPAPPAPVGPPASGATVPAPTGTVPDAGARPTASLGGLSGPPVAAARAAEGNPLGWVRYVLVAVAIAGLAGAFAGPVLLRIGRFRP